MELNLSSTSFQQLVERTTASLVRALEHLETNEPTSYVESTHDCPEGVEAARSLALGLKDNTAPEHGKELSEVLDIVCQRATKAGLNHASGGFCAFITGGGLLHTAVADLLSATMNRFTGVFLGAPGYVQLECNVINWMCQIVGYPEGSFGCFTSGGSMANFVGLLVARRYHFREEEISSAVVFVTNETHSCIPKSAMMAGLPESSICEVAYDAELRMDPEALEAAITRERSAGRKPFLVVATTGTTNAGTVDDMPSLAAVCQRQGVWLHVDGVYGAPFNLTKRGQRVLVGLEEADSIAVDLHKSFFLPNGTGLLLVKRRQTLHNAFTLQTTASYYPDFDPIDTNFYELSPELTRSFRGMRIWLPLQLCGLEKWREALDERLDWTEKFYGGLQALSNKGIETLNKPDLSLIIFRYVPKHKTNALSLSKEGHPVHNGDVRSTDTSQELKYRAAELRQINIHLLKFINRQNHIFLSPTVLKDGRFVLRICILHLRLTWQRLEQGLQDIANGVDNLELLSANGITRPDSCGIPVKLVAFNGIDSRAELSDIPSQRSVVDLV